MTRLLGIDHGSRRVGIAIADTRTGIAFARRAMVRRGGTADIAAVAELATAEDVELVVVGLPLNMDGSEGPQAAAARAFGERLSAIGLQVSYVDERLSSWDARERLAAAGRSPTRSSGELDSAAASVILQQYLDMTKESE